MKILNSSTWVPTNLVGVRLALRLPSGIHEHVQHIKPLFWQGLKSELENVTWLTIFLSICNITLNWISNVLFLTSATHCFPSATIELTIKKLKSEPALYSIWRFWFNWLVLGQFRDLALSVQFIYFGQVFGSKNKQSL